MLGKILEALIKFGGPLVELLSRVTMAEKDKEPPDYSSTLEHMDKVDRDIDSAISEVRGVFNGKKEEEKKL